LQKDSAIDEAVGQGCLARIGRANQRDSILGLALR